MIKNINSNLIKRRIFLLISNERKYKLIIYNKKLKSILNLNISNFRKFSRKYKIGDRNWFGSEYKKKVN